MKSTWSAIVLSVVMINQGGLRAAPQIAKPLYQVTVVQSAAKAINYRNLDGSVEIDFKGTVLLPSANGMASVKNKSGVTNIKAEFENVSAPSQFGAEYLTYIFWGVDHQRRKSGNRNQTPAPDLGPDCDGGTLLRRIPTKQCGCFGERDQAGKQRQDRIS